MIAGVQSGVSVCFYSMGPMRLEEAGVRGDTALPCKTLRASLALLVLTLVLKIFGHSEMQEKIILYR